MNYSIIRCICALVIGVLLVAWPEAAILYLVITIGVLFLVPGLFSLSGYLIRGKQDGSRFPIAGLGSLLFGLWLMIMPAFFVGILMYVLGAVLVLAGISQIVNLSAARSWTVVPGGFFVIPVLVLIAGIVVLFNPFTAAAVPFIILGVSSIVYGLSDLINIIRFRQKKEPGMPEIEDINLLILCVVVGCKGTSSPSTASETDEYAGTCEGEKAKAILWVDYKRGRKITDGTPIRTVKVYADVHADGSLKVLSWCKKQPMKVENYLLKRVEVYRIRKEIFEGGYLKPGEQYLQLRYLPGEVK